MRHVIIGTSAAGLAAAELLRARDPQGEITLVSEEAELPYSRPLLTYLLGRQIRPDKIYLKTPDYFARRRLTAKWGQAVVAVRPQTRQVRLADGEELPYDRLLIASGARPRLLGLPGEQLPGVFTLRHLADVRRLEFYLTPGAPVAVIGGGAVGLKAVEAFRHRGHPVALIELEDRLLPRLLDPTAADLLAEVVREQGVRLFLNSRVTEYMESQGKIAGVALADGREIPAGAVLVAVGVEARTEFLEGTLPATPEGIPVNSFLETALPDIYAAGDCALPPPLLPGQPPAYKIWPAAVAQGQVAAINMAGGRKAYEGLLPQNSLSFLGFQLISGGMTSPAGEGEVFAALDRRRRQYRRLVFQEGRLVGLTLIGEVEPAGLYFQILTQKLPVRALGVDPRSRDFHPGGLWG